MNDPEAPRMTPEITGERAALRIVCVSDAPARAAALREAVLALLPRAQVLVMDDASERGSVPSGDAVVVDVEGGDELALEVARRLRGRGYAGGLVVLADAPHEALAGDARRLGARTVRRDALAEELPAALGGVLAAGGALVAPLRRLQQLLAAGQMTSRLQHDINNPLAALLAEAQLLELEPLTGEHLEAVRRIVQQARRVIEIVRRLDGVGTDPAAARHRTPPRGYETNA